MLAHFKPERIFFYQGKSVYIFRGLENSDIVQKEDLFQSILMIMSFSMAKLKRGIPLKSNI